MEEILEDIIKMSIEGVQDTTYFRDKGYSKGIIDTYKLGYLSKGLLPYKDSIDEDPRVLECYKYVIPNFDREGNIAYVILRKDPLTEMKKLPFKLASSYFIGDYLGKMWNLKSLYELKGSRTIFIAETWTDALSIEEVGYHAIALNRITNVLTLWKVLSKMNNISEYGVVAICDNDYYGNKANKDIMNICYNLGCKGWLFSSYPEKINDTNEWLQYNRDTLKESLDRFVENIMEE